MSHLMWTKESTIQDAISVVQPTFKTVPIADVRKVLPADTPRVTPEERQASLRRRYHAVLRRFRE